jgi:hypothetical protein
MDPDATLKEARELAQDILDGGADTAEAERLAELFQALDEWLSGSGYLPEDWRQG